MYAPMNNCAACKSKLGTSGTSTENSFSTMTNNTGVKKYGTGKLFMGAYIGLLLKPDMIKLGKRVLLLGVGSALFLLAITFFQGLLLVYLLDYSLSTSFLSAAAGGLDQMSLLANSIGADVSVVTVFQIFRLLFVFLLVLPLLKVACSYLDRREKVLKEQIE